MRVPRSSATRPGRARRAAGSKEALCPCFADSDSSAALLAAPAFAEEQSATEINKQLTNPVSELWSITFQQNNFRVDPGEGQGNRWSSNLLFQPVLPVAISDDWNLITRPVVPLFVSTPRPDPEPGDPTNIDRSTAFGDITLLQLVSPSPKLVGNWLLGFGPTWIFPTANSDFTGQDKYQVGPAALVGYLADKWIVGGLYQSWWSFSGSDLREDTASMNFQPFASYFLKDGWSVGYWEILGGLEEQRRKRLHGAHRVGRLEGDQARQAPGPVSARRAVDGGSARPLRTEVELPARDLPGAPEAHPGEPRRSQSARVWTAEEVTLRRALLVVLVAALGCVACTPPGPDFQKLVGRWLRSEGGYVIDVRSIDASGRLDAAYLNPRPIHVARAEATLDGSVMKVFLELRDVNYPGSTYTLTYDPERDQLDGVYYQAVEQQHFQVSFTRMR